MHIREICNRNIVTVDRADAVLTAARLMRDQHVGCVVAVESVAAQVRPVGVLTDRDIVVAVLALNLDAEEISVGDVMSSKVTTISEDETVARALELMRAAGVRRLPVIGADGALAGIVSSDDIVQALAGDVAALAEIIGSEQQRERERRHVRV